MAELPNPAGQTCAMGMRGVNGDVPLRQDFELDMGSRDGHVPVNHGMGTRSVHAGHAGGNKT